MGGSLALGCCQGGIGACGQAQQLVRSATPFDGAALCIMRNPYDRRHRIQDRLQFRCMGAQQFLRRLLHRDVVIELDDPRCSPGFIAVEHPMAGNGNRAAIPGSVSQLAKPVAAAEQLSVDLVQLLRELCPEEIVRDAPERFGAGPAVKTLHAVGPEANASVKIADHRMGEVEGSCERLAAGACRAVYVP